MTEQNAEPTPASGIPASPSISVPPERLQDLRRLSHDLSNSLEIIVQTSYLLSTTNPEGPAAQWMQMLDQGVQQALKINVELRTAVRAMV